MDVESRQRARAEIQQALAKFRSTEEADREARRAQIAAARDQVRRTNAAPSSRPSTRRADVDAVVGRSGLAGAHAATAKRRLRTARVGEKITIDGVTLERTADGGITVRRTPSRAPIRILDAPADVAAMFGFAPRSGGAMTDRWITSFDQVAPPDVVARLHVPPERIGIIAALLATESDDARWVGATAEWKSDEQRWVGATALVVYDSPDIEVLLVDDEGRSIVVRAPWMTFFIESWTSELDEQFDADAGETLEYLREQIIDASQ